MKREEYKFILLGKGFTFLKTQMGYPSRGEEDVYTHPDYKFNLYITHVSKEDKDKYGFLTGKVNGKQLEDIYPSNFDDSCVPEKGLYVWVDEAFVELMDKLCAK
jgi:hypothetical protein